MKLDKWVVIGYLDLKQSFLIEDQILNAMKNTPIYNQLLSLKHDV